MYFLLVCNGRSYLIILQQYQRFLILKTQLMFTFMTRMSCFPDHCSVLMDSTSSDHNRSQTHTVAFVCKVVFRSALAIAGNKSTQYNLEVFFKTILLPRSNSCSSFFSGKNFHNKRIYSCLFHPHFIAAIYHGI